MIRNKGLSAAEAALFGEMFEKYCKGEVEAGLCPGDTCEYCLVKDCRDEVFRSLGRNVSPAGAPLGEAPAGGAAGSLMTGRRGKTGEARGNSGRPQGRGRRDAGDGRLSFSRGRQ